jgi:hypothetical protein
MSRVLRSLPLAVGLMLSAAGAEANVISDWDGKAAAIVPPSAAGLREMAIMHVAMFDAVNSIEPRHRPYLIGLTPPKPTSQEAAAATAAATVLMALRPDAATGIKAALANDLAGIPDGASKADGIKLGEVVAEKVLQARENEGANAPEQPITAIRNGDIDGNSATESEATRQPIDNTPMHPEYPWRLTPVVPVVEGDSEAEIGRGGFRWNSLYYIEYIQA